MPKASMTYHAWQRLCQRCVYSIEQLCQIVDDDRVVLIGQETGTNRMHKLFYSPDDEMYFVVVQDIKTGEIITVMPPDYHHRFAISDDAIRMAKEIALGRNESAAAIIEPQPESEPVSPLPNVLRFTVYVRGFIDNKVKIRQFKIRDKATVCKLLRLNRPEVDSKSRIEAFTQLYNGCIAKDKRQGYAVESVYYQAGNEDRRIPYLLD